MTATVEQSTAATEGTPASALHSSSETVRRHASAFARTWPEPARPFGEYRPAPAPPKTARPAGLDELGDGRSKRVQVAKAADVGGWEWRAHLADAPDGEGGHSAVMRFRQALTFPWDVRRVVAYWSAKPGRPLAFVAAFTWREYGGVVLGERAPVAALDLVAFLRDPPPLAPVRRPPPRRRSKRDLSTVW